MNILIMSDLVPPAGTGNVYTDGKIEDLLDAQVLKKIQEADINIVNLECPLTESDKKTEKWGSHLKASPLSIALLKKIPHLVVNLANNHIRDYGDKGIDDTISLLEKNGIEYIGIRKNRNLLSQVKIIQVEDNSIGVLSCTEHEFSEADNERSGACPFELGEIILQIIKCRKEVDYFVLLYHGGVEFYPYPTPKMQENMHRLIEAGLDLIVCQHSHCMGCAERYLNGTIVYGQGNFLFADVERVAAYVPDWNMWKHGMLISVQLPGGTVEYHTYRNEEGKLCLVNDDENEKKEFIARSRDVKDPEIVQRKWTEYCQQHMEYAKIFKRSFEDGPGGRKKALRHALNSLLNVYRNSPNDYYQIYDYLSCEAHIELLKEICKIKMREQEEL